MHCRLNAEHNTLILNIVCSTKTYPLKRDGHTIALYLVAVHFFNPIEN
jgi:hypothetical protein